MKNNITTVISPKEIGTSRIEYKIPFTSRTPIIILTKSFLIIFSIITLFKISLTLKLDLQILYLIN